MLSAARASTQRAGYPSRAGAFSGGNYSVAVHGDRFVFVETAKVGSFDELRRLLHEITP